MSVDDLVAPPVAMIEVRRDRSRTVTVEGPHRAEFGHRVRGSRDDREGIHAGWEWDGQRLTAWVDRYGMWPLFFAADDQCIRVSDSLAAIGARLKERTLHAGALGVFVRLGFFLGDETPFAAIRAFPPGGELRWDGTLDVKSVRPVGRRSTLSFEQCVDAYIDLFRQSIGRRRPVEGVRSLPLSGGRDSRHIALELSAQRCPVGEYVTISREGQATCRDITGARRVADRLGVRHVVVQGAGPMLVWEEHKNLATHFAADEHAWIAPVFAYLARQGGPSLDGIGGDVLSAGLFNSSQRSGLMRTGALEQLANDIIRQWSPAPEGVSQLESLLGIHVPHHDVVERVARSLAEFAEDPNPVAAFFFWNRTRREIALAPFGLGRASRQYAPFLDHDVFDLLTSLPPEFSFDGRLHDASLVRAYGELGSRSDSAFRRIHGGPTVWRRMTQSLAGRLARRAVRRVRSVSVVPVDPNASRIAGNLVRRTLYAAQLQRFVSAERSTQRHRDVAPTA